MWNKYKKRIAKLEEENHWLNKNYNDAKRDLEKRKEEPKESKSAVYAYLKNHKTITFLEADDFRFISGDDLIQILKNNESIGLVRIEDVIAISNSPVSVSDNEYFYTIDGRRI